MDRTLEIAAWGFAVIEAGRGNGGLWAEAMALLSVHKPYRRSRFPHFHRLGDYGEDEYLLKTVP